MKYKLVVADFDDTTVSEDLTISPGVRQAIKEYVQRGGIFTFCTGRMVEGIIGYARDLNLLGEVIGYQGAEVADINTGDIVYRDRIPHGIALDICKFLDVNDEHYNVYDGGNFYVARDSEYARAYEKYTGTKRNIANMNLSEFVAKQAISPVKIMLTINPKLNKFYLSKLNQKFGEVVNVNTSKSHLIEIVNKSVDKGKAVERLAKKLGIARENVACIGDALSDVPMIIYAGLGVCMENANEDIKSLADLIVPSVKEDGLAYFIKNYCM